MAAAKLCELPAEDCLLCSRYPQLWNTGPKLQWIGSKEEYATTRAETGSRWTERASITP